MKFLVVCVFALLATNIAGESVAREKRSALHNVHAFTHHETAHALSAGHAHITPLIHTHAIHHNVPLTHDAPLAQVAHFVHAPPLDQLNAAHLIHPASAIPIAADPAIGHHALYERLPVPVSVSHTVPQSHPVYIQHQQPTVAIQHHQQPALTLHAITSTHAIHGHPDLNHYYGHGAPIAHHF